MMISPSPLLRQGLLADAVTSLGFGAMLSAAAHPLASLLALPVPLLQIAGIVLLPFAALLVFLSLRTHLPRKAVLFVVAVNIFWAAESCLLLAGGLIAPNAAGTAFILAQAVAVLMYAALQARGLTRSAALAG